MTSKDRAIIRYVMLALEFGKCNADVHSPTSSSWPAINDPQPSTHNTAMHAASTQRPLSVQDNTRSTSQFRVSILESAERMQVEQIAKKKPIRSTKAPAKSKKVKPTIVVHEDDNTVDASAAGSAAPGAMRGRSPDLALKKSAEAADMLSPSRASDLNARPKLAEVQKRKLQDDFDILQSPKRARITSSSRATGLDLRPVLKQAAPPKDITAAPASESKDAAVTALKTPEMAGVSSETSHATAAKGVQSNKRKRTPDPFDADDGLFDKLLTEEIGVSSHLPPSYQTTQALTKKAVKTCAAGPRRTSSKQPILSSPPALLPSLSTSPGSQQSPMSTPSSPIKPFLRDASSIMATTCVTRVPHLQAQHQAFTCFRIAEARRLCSLVEGPEFVVNLYARVKRSYRVGPSDSLNICFADLFFPHKPPYFESTCRDLRTVRLGVDVVESLDEGLGPVKAIIKLRNRAGGSQSPRQTHDIEVLSISKSTWNDVLQAKDLLDMDNFEDDEVM